MTCCRNSVYLICGLLLLALLGGCSYKSVVIKVDQDSTQKSGGSSIGGSTTGDVPQITRTAAEEMGDVLQPVDLKQLRKLLEQLPDYLKQGAISSIIGSPVPDLPVLEPDVDPRWPE